MKTDSGGLLSASVSSNYTVRLGLLAGFDDWRCPSDGKLKFIDVSQGDSDLSVAHILDPGYYAVVVSPFDDTGLECKSGIGYDYTLKIDSHVYNTLPQLDDVSLPSGGGLSYGTDFGYGGGYDGPGGNGGFGGGGGGKLLRLVCCVYSIWYVIILFVDLNYTLLFL